MPELPEVETIRCGLEPLVAGQKIADVILRNRSLRWPVHAELAGMVRGQVIQTVERISGSCRGDSDAGASRG